MKVRNILMNLVLFTCSINFVFGIKPDTNYVVTPDLFGLIYKEFQVKTADNYEINVWFYPSQYSISNDSIKYNNSNKIVRKYEVIEYQRPTVIICNGDAGSMSYLIHYAQFLSTNGYNVVTFDWRGFGKSQGFTFDSNIVCQEFLWDYNTVLEAILNIPEVDSSRIGAFGFSTGAYISFIEFYKNYQIKALALRGMFTSYQDVLPILNDLFPGEKRSYPPIFDTNNYKADFICKEISKPIFFIVGELDDRTPPEMSLNLLDCVKSSCRSLWIVKGAGHGGDLAPEIVEWEEFKSRVLAFFNTNL